MKNILFPKNFRFIGWILFVPGLILALLCHFDLITPSGISRTVISDVIIVGIVLGSVFIVCSKEQHEDEMIRAIRLSAILNAIYAYVIIFISGTILINGEDYINFILFTLFLLPLILVFIFIAELQRYYRQNVDEE